MLPKMYSNSCSFSVIDLCLVIIVGFKCTLALRIASSENPVDQTATEELVKEFRIKQFLLSMAERLEVSPEQLQHRTGGGQPERRRPLLEIPAEILEQNLAESHGGEDDDDDNEDDDDDDDPVRREDVFIPGQGAGKQCTGTKASSGCFQFDAKDIQGEMTSATLLVPRRMVGYGGKVHHSILFINDPHGRGQVLTQRVSKSLNITTKSGWASLTLDLPTLKAWMSQKAGKKLIGIRCHPFCPTTHQYQPHIAKAVLHITVTRRAESAAAHHRRRRSVGSNCDPNTGCCKMDLEIDFENILHYNVATPSKLKIDYCHGRCSSIETQLGLNVSHLTIKNHMRNTDPSMREKLNVCCVPTVFQARSFFIYTEDGYLRRDTMPHAAIKKCECL